MRSVTMSSISVITLLTCFAQVHSQPAWTVRTAPVLRAAPVVQATKGAWKVESTKGSNFPVSQQKWQSGTPQKANLKKVKEVVVTLPQKPGKIWNVVEGQDALIADLKAEFDTPVRKTNGPGSQTVVVDKVTKSQLIDFLKKSGNYQQTASGLAKIKAKKNVKINTEKLKERTAKNAEKKAAEGGGEEGEGGGEGDKAPESTELFTQNVTSVFTVPLLACVMVSGIVFALLFRRNGASSTHTEPLLPIYV